VFRKDIVEVLYGIEDSRGVLNDLNVFVDHLTLGVVQICIEVLLYEGWLATHFFSRFLGLAVLIYFNYDR